MQDIDSTVYTNSWGRISVKQQRAMTKRKDAEVKVLLLPWVVSVLFFFCYYVCILPKCLKLEMQFLYNHYYRWLDISQSSWRCGRLSRLETLINYGWIIIFKSVVALNILRLTCARILNVARRSLEIILTFLSLKLNNPTAHDIDNNDKNDMWIFSNILQNKLRTFPLWNARL